MLLLYLKNHLLILLSLCLFLFHQRLELVFITVHLPLMVLFHLRNPGYMIIFELFSGVQVHLDLMFFFLLDLGELHIALFFFELNFVLQFLNLALGSLSGLLENACVSVFSLVDLCLENFDVFYYLLTDLSLNEHFRSRSHSWQRRLLAPWILV